MKRNITDVTWTILLGLTVVFSAGFGFAQSGTWTPTGSMAGGRVSHPATLLTNGKVLIPGWYNTAAELYDPAAETFSLTGNMVFAHGSGATANRFPDGRVLIVGGLNAPTAAEIYDPATETFSATGSLNARHSFHTATLLLDGRVLVAGGHGQEPYTNSTSTNIAEIYDPITGISSLTGSLSSPRSGAAAALLPDGRVLIAAGQNAKDGYTVALVPSAELYSPATGIFSPTTGNTAAGGQFLWGAGAPVLPNGKVLIVGWGTQLAELFDPSTGIFSATGGMAAARINNTATLLANGQVLVAGGLVPGPNGSALGSAELYDPVSGTFAPTAGMNESRQAHTATLLWDGRVLVVAGVNNGPEILASAELYTPAVVNRAPAAICRDIRRPAGNGCQANAAAQDFDNGSYDPDGDPLIYAISPVGPYSLSDTPVTLTVTDTHGAKASCSAKITVYDDTPPSITSLAANPNSLWPANHKMVPVSITLSAIDNCSPTVTSKIVKVTSNEPVNGLGDGDTAPDWLITGPLTLNLRAERSGNGTGRIYTITIECRDAAGNKATGVVTVKVPKSQGK